MRVCRIEAAEAVWQKLVQRDFFLPDEARLRQLALGQQVQHRADRAGGGDLDGALDLAADGLGVNLAGVRSPASDGRPSVR